MRPELSQTAVEEGETRGDCTGYAFTLFQAIPLGPSVPIELNRNRLLCSGVAQVQRD